MKKKCKIKIVPPGPSELEGASRTNKGAEELEQISNK